MEIGEQAGDDHNGEIGINKIFHKKINKSILLDLLFFAFAISYLAGGSIRFRGAEGELSEQHSDLRKNTGTAGLFEKKYEEIEMLTL